MPDAHKNLAYSLVATAPSPAASGTSLVVTAGQGALFPTVPFNATIWPVGANPITTNAEIVRVTAISTDTLTITRAQESTSARTVIVGDQIAATITAKTLEDIEANATESGWIAVTDSWSFSSADNPTGVITIPSDGTTKYSVGMRIRLTQSTVKYFLVTAVSATTLTVYGGTDYTLANAAISAISFATVKAPFGFPLDSDKWSETLTDSTERSQASPVANTWYNLGSLSKAVPIGLWLLEYKVYGQANRTSGDADVFTTFSTGTTTESNADFTIGIMGTPMASFQALLKLPPQRLTAAAKTTYYFNTRTTASSITNIYNRNEYYSFKLRMVSAYL